MAVAILFASPDVVETRPVEIPAPEPGELLLRTRYSLVSPGTELRSLAGLQSGLENAFPFIPGYSTIGEAEDGSLYFAMGTQRASVARGWGAHVSHVVVKASDAIPLPHGVDPKEALFAKMWGIAWRGFVGSGFQPGMTAAVVGLGLVGQLSARLLHAAGAELLVVDPGPFRRSLAPGEAVESISAARERRPEGSDVVIDATGIGAVLPEGLALLRDVPWHGPGEGATYVVQGSYADQPPLPYNVLFRKEARLVFPRDNRRPDTEVLLQRIAAGELRAGDLAGDDENPDRAPELYDELKKRGSKVTARFNWTELGTE